MTAAGLKHHALAQVAGGRRWVEEAVKKLIAVDFPTPTSPMNAIWWPFFPRYTADASIAAR